MTSGIGGSGGSGGLGGGRGTGWGGNGGGGFPWDRSRLRRPKPPAALETPAVVPSHCWAAEAVRRCADLRPIASSETSVPARSVSRFAMSPDPAPTRTARRTRRCCDEPSLRLRWRRGSERVSTYSTNLVGVRSTGLAVRRGAVGSRAEQGHEERAGQGSDAPDVGVAEEQDAREETSQEAPHRNHTREDLKHGATGPPSRPVTLLESVETSAAKRPKSDNVCGRSREAYKAASPALGAAPLVTRPIIRPVSFCAGKLARAPVERSRRRGPRRVLAACTAHCCLGSVCLVWFLFVDFQGTASSDKQ